MITFKLKREIKCFIVAGVIATLTDFIIYWGLHFFLFYSTAKALSFCCGSLVAYFLNKFITFKRNRHSMTEALSFGMLYGFVLVVNVSVNSLSLFFLSKFLPFSSSFILVFAFLMATGVSTVISFVGQRLWVFKSI